MSHTAAFPTRIPRLLRRLAQSVLFHLVISCAIWPPVVNLLASDPLCSLYQHLVFHGNPPLPLSPSSSCFGSSTDVARIFAPLFLAPILLLVAPLFLVGMPGAIIADQREELILLALITTGGLSCLGLVLNPFLRKLLSLRMRLVTIHLFVPLCVIGGNALILGLAAAFVMN